MNALTLRARFPYNKALHGRALESNEAAAGCGSALCFCFLLLLLVREVGDILPLFFG